MGKRDIASSFLTSSLDGGERLASRPSRFTPRRNSIPYPLDRRLNGPQRRCGRYEEEKNIINLPGNPISSNLAHSLVTIMTELPPPFSYRRAKKMYKFYSHALVFLTCNLRDNGLLHLFSENFA
jgi:hypothetical protein